MKRLKQEKAVRDIQQAERGKGVGVTVHCGACIWNLLATLIVNYDTSINVS